METAQLLFLLGPLPLVLSLLPFEFDGFIFAIFHKLINDVVNFEAVNRWFVADNRTLLAIEVANEASLPNDKRCQQRIWLFVGKITLTIL